MKMTELMAKISGHYYKFKRYEDLVFVGILTSFGTVKLIDILKKKVRKNV